MVVEFDFIDDIVCDNCAKIIMHNIAYKVVSDDDGIVTRLCAVCMKVMLDDGTLVRYAPAWDSDFGRDVIETGNNIWLGTDAVRKFVADTGGSDVE